MGYPLRPLVNRGLLLSVREMQMRQRPSALNTESEACPRWRGCSVSGRWTARHRPCQGVLEGGGARRRLERKMFFPVFPYLEQPSQGYQRYPLVVVTGFS
jgi:hypothetical protein